MFVTEKKFDQAIRQMLTDIRFMLKDSHEYDNFENACALCEHGVLCTDGTGLYKVCCSKKLKAQCGDFTAKTMPLE